MHVSCYPQTPRPQEFERFKQGWLAADFPAWLEQRRPGIEHYRAMTQVQAAAAASRAPPPPLRARGAA